MRGARVNLSHSTTVRKSDYIVLFMRTIKFDPFDLISVVMDMTRWRILYHVDTSHLPRGIKYA